MMPEIAHPNDPKPPWGVIAFYDDTEHTYHLAPSWDIRDHLLRECWCDPEVDELGRIVHKSADGRERYEDGFRRRH